LLLSSSTPGTVQKTPCSVYRDSTAPWLRISSTSLYSRRLAVALKASGWPQVNLQGWDSDGQLQWGQLQGCRTCVLVLLPCSYTLQTFDLGVPPYPRALHSPLCFSSCLSAATTSPFPTSHPGIPPFHTRNMSFHPSRLLTDIPPFHTQLCHSTLPHSTMSFHPSTLHWDSNLPHSTMSFHPSTLNYVIPPFHTRLSCHSTLPHSTMLIHPSTLNYVIPPFHTQHYLTPPFHTQPCIPPFHTQ